MGGFLHGGTTPSFDVTLREIEHDLGNRKGERRVSAAREMTRRELLDYFVGGGFVATVAAGVLGTLSYLRPGHGAKPTGGGPVEVGDANEIPVGSAKAVKFREKSALVIHTKRGFVGLSAICTHAECVVYWDEAEQLIKCPCHAGVFDTNGNRVSGPPPRPLPAYRVEVVAGKIMLGGA